MDSVTGNPIELDERRVLKAMWSPNRLLRPTQFRVRRIKTGKWVVVFEDQNATKYILVKKMSGNKIPKIREFSRLNGVQMWMQQMEIDKFTVLLR